VVELQRSDKPIPLPSYPAIELPVSAYDVYLSPPHLSGMEMEFMREVVEANWIAPVGPYVTTFERELAQICGSASTVATVSGTAALHLAYLVGGIKPGDEVIVPTFTYVATVSPLLYIGAKPIFVGASWVDYGLDVNALEWVLYDRARRNRRTPRVVVAHLYGMVSNMDDIVDLCGRYGAVLFEDAAESLGATYKGRFAGTISRFGATSFNGNKIVTTGGGGALFTESDSFSGEARRLAAHSRKRVAWYEHSDVGYSYRMNGLAAAFGRAQIRVLDSRIAARRQIFETYRRLLAGLPFVFLEEPPNVHCTRWLTTVHLTPAALKEGITPLRLHNVLAEAGIESRLLWKPLHTQPLFKGSEYWGNDDAQRMFDTGLALPSGSELTEEQQIRICNVLAEEINRSSYPLSRYLSE
jgi:pyridoxal phosphate-dependent aminotransferase EpsN